MNFLLMDYFLFDRLDTVDRLITSDSSLYKTKIFMNEIYKYGLEMMLCTVIIVFVSKINENHAHHVCPLQVLHGNHF